MKIMQNTQPAVEAVSDTNAPATAGPYSPAVRAANGTVFVSGQLPMRADGSIAINESPEEQLRLCLDNAISVAAAAGAPLESIARVVVYTTDLTAAASLNAVYEETFSSWQPARSMIEVSALPRGACVEVEVTAIANEATVRAAQTSATPAADKVVYLNTGTAGPALAVALDALIVAAERDRTEPRTTLARFGGVMEDAAAARAAVARIVHADPLSIALTHNTTEGMNIATWGLDWKPGDRVLTTDVEHMGASLPLYQLARRFGVAIDFVSLQHIAPEDSPAAIESALTPRTRMFVFSHVAYSTGALFPLAEIVRLCHSNGTLVAADGAQSFGAIPLDLPSTEVDFYAVPGQKWLCGPEGSGALYVAPSMLDVLKPTFTGFFGVDYPSYAIGDSSTLVPAAGAQRYEVGSAYHPVIVGFGRAAEWWADHNEDDSLTDAIRTLTDYAIDVLEATPGIRVITPASRAGLVSFEIDGDVDEAVLFLSQNGVDIRAVHETHSLRFSCGHYNSRIDIDRAVALVVESISA